MKRDSEIAAITPESRLKSSEIRYRRLFESAKDGILILDCETGVVIDVNPYLENILGYSHEHFIGKKIWELGFLKDIASSQEKFIELLNKEYVRYDDLPLETADGKKVDVEFVSNVYMSDNVKVIQCNIRNITERKRASAALKASEERFRSYMQNAPDGVFVVDNNGRYIDVNQSACRITGYAIEELKMMSLADLLVEESREDGIRFLKKLIESGSANCHLWQRHRDGSKLCLMIDAVKLSESRILGFFKDETARIRNEEDLHKYREHLEELVRKRTKQLEIAEKAANAASHAKSAFLSNMSHEIRTPLNSILGFTQLLLRDSSLSSQHKEHLSVIGRSGEHLLVLINDILDFSKIEAGYVTNNTVIFNLFALLNEARDMFQTKADSKRLRLVMEQSDDLPEFILSDKQKLQQILINLMGNAVKFTEEGGLTVRTRVDRQKNGLTNLIIEVEDSGHGIAEKDKEKIFNAFEQAQSEIKSGGTGLGLTLSRQFVRLMGGEITVKSEINKGTCFILAIPIQEAKAPLTKKESPQKIVKSLKPGTQPLRVLIVDDEPDNRTLLKALLIPAGFETREAGDGNRAIELFDQWHPHLILMDMRMPVMNGPEAIMRIKKMQRGAETKIIAVTASAFNEEKSKILDNGADGYLRKPFKEQELFESIQSVVNVQYEYEADTIVKKPDTGMVLSKQSLSSLPGELLEKVWKAAVNLDNDSLRVLINRISEISTHLGAQFNTLLRSYRYDELISLCRK